MVRLLIVGVSALKSIIDADAKGRIELRTPGIFVDLHISLSKKVSWKCSASSRLDFPSDNGRPSLRFLPRSKEKKITDPTGVYRCISGSLSNPLLSQLLSPPPPVNRQCNHILLCHPQFIPWFGAESHLASVARFVACTPFAIVISGCV